MGFEEMHDLKGRLLNLLSKQWSPKPSSLDQIHPLSLQSKLRGQQDAERKLLMFSVVKPSDEYRANRSSFVCVTNKDTGTAFRLRSYRSTWEPGTGCTIWQAARATTAAPLYFPPMRCGHPLRTYVDGGISHNNNPIRALWDEAKKVWGKTSRSIGCIVSIGTGVPALKSTGNTGKSIIENLVKISTDTHEMAKNFANDMENLPTTEAIAYFRFNVEQGLQDVKLEEWKSFDALGGATDEYLNTRRSKIDKCANAILDLDST